LRDSVRSARAWAGRARIAAGGPRACPPVPSLPPRPEAANSRLEAGSAGFAFQSCGSFNAKEQLLHVCASRAESHTSRKARCMRHPPAPVHHCEHVPPRSPICQSSLMPRVRPNRRPERKGLRQPAKNPRHPIRAVATPSIGQCGNRVVPRPLPDGLSQRPTETSTASQHPRKILREIDCALA